MGKSQKKVQRKKIDVTDETEVLFKPSEDGLKKKQKKESNMFFEDKTSTKSSSKRKWKNKMLHSDLIVSSDKKRVIDTDLAMLDFSKAARTLKNRRKNGKGTPKAPVSKVGSYDLWAEGSRPADVPQKVNDPSDGWLAGVEHGHMPKGVKWRRTSALPPIELPGDEDSYIPKPEAYNEMVEKEEKALERIENRTKRFEKTFGSINVKKILSRREAFRQRAMAIVDDDVVDHPSMVLPDKGDHHHHQASASANGAEEEEEIISDKSAEGFPVMAKLRAEARRRQLNRKSEFKGVPKNPNMFKKFVNRQLNDIDRIAAEVENKVAADKQRFILRRNRRRVIRSRPGYRIGRTKFVDDPKLIIDPDRLPNNLRSMPNETSLLRYRYKNLQKRNIIFQGSKGLRPKRGTSRRLKFVEKTAIRMGLEDHGGDEVSFISSL